MAPAIRQNVVTGSKLLCLLVARPIVVGRTQLESSLPDRISGLDPLSRHYGCKGHDDRSDQRIFFGHLQYMLQKVSSGNAA